MVFKSDVMATVTQRHKRELERRTDERKRPQAFWLMELKSSSSTVCDHNRFQMKTLFQCLFSNRPGITTQVSVVEGGSLNAVTSI